MSLTNLSVTESQIAIGGDGVRLGAAMWGETVTNGIVVYLKSSDSKYYKADCATNIAEASARGIVLDKGTGTNGTRGTIIRSGPIDLGASVSPALTEQEAYLLSITAGEGNIMECTTANLAELSVGDFCVHLGHAETARILDVNINVNTTAITTV
jgi:hypothetical protein